MKTISRLCTLALLLASVPTAAVATENGASEMIRKVEMRRGLWVNLQATLQMDFATPKGKKASCRADLLYDRLDEKILLKGFAGNNELLFVFRTDDRFFDLYLPRQNAVFSGTIFDLEDSPEIHSHLKALDLYRSLKPMALPAEKTRVSREQGLVRLEITDAKGRRERALFANKDGDTLREIYYRRDGTPRTLIERSDFTLVKKSKADTFSFPRVIRIESYAPRSREAAKAGNETRLTFDRTDFSPVSGERSFDYEFPEDAKRADVGESFRKQLGSQDSNEISPVPASS
jgi:hypothetical protein